MNGSSSDINTSTSKSLKVVEESLAILWNKINQICEQYKALRKANHDLNQQIQNIIAENNQLKSALNAKEQEIKRLKNDIAQATPTDNSVIISNEEKEFLKNRIRDLITKINSHL